MQSKKEAEFDVMQLHVGASMQLQSETDGATPNTVRFIGAVKGKSVIATVPFVEGKPAWMQAGRRYIIRGFTGMVAYAFEAEVLQAHAHPYSYVHFSYPRTTSTRPIRKSLRLRIDLPATITPKSGAPIAVDMVDISTNGAMLLCKEPVGNPSEALTVSFPVAFDDIETNLNLSAIIRSIQKGEDGARVGVEFLNVAHNDGLLLRCYTHTLEPSS
jgi:c-di-GMP-binding flagellar brake protein YcgR